MLNYFVNLLVPKAYAALFPAPSISNYTKYQSLNEFINEIPGFLQQIGFILFVIAFIAAGFLYLTSRDNEEQTTRAKQALVAAVIGLIIIIVGELLAWYITLSIAK